MFKIKNDKKNKMISFIKNFFKNLTPLGIIKLYEKYRYYNFYNYKTRIINNKKEIFKLKKLNLCSGSNILYDYINLDVSTNSDIICDLEKKNLPFKNNQFDTIVCISAINYFERKRAIEILKEVYRVLEYGGIFRISTQCLDKLINHYINKNKFFFNQTGKNNLPLFPGENFSEKLLNWFYGFETIEGHKTKYIYNFEILSNILKNIGFKNIENKKFLDSKIKNIDKIDNREDQCFFLECEK